MAETESRRLVRRGRCHVVGDDVSMDNGIIPARFSTQRVTDPKELAPHLFETVDGRIASRIRSGDIVLAGRNFACGKPRVQGFIAMGDLQLSVLCTSMPYRMLRRAVARGIPVITGIADVAGIAGDGDELEIDFASGSIRNLTRSVGTSAPAMPPVLRDIVAAGGMHAVLREWLAEHPEQAVGPG